MTPIRVRDPRVGVRHNQPMTTFRTGDRVLYGDPRPLTEGDGDVGTVLEAWDVPQADGGQVCRVHWDKGAFKIETIEAARLTRVLYETAPAAVLWEEPPDPRTTA